jgi:adenylate cyclase
MPAPVASGWSDRRVGLAPTGKAPPCHGARGNGAIELGIGLHAGDAFCGAVGDEARLEFTVLGDTVNVAARLEQETKAVGLPLVVSRAFLAAAGETVEGPNWQPLGARTLRRRNQSICSARTLLATLSEWLNSRKSK